MLNTESTAPGEATSQQFTDWKGQLTAVGHRPGAFSEWRLGPDCVEKGGVSPQRD